MAGQLYEIMTKATLAKGLKKTIHKYEFTVDQIDKILGCWISNHQFQGMIIMDNDVHIKIEDIYEIDIEE